MDFQDLKQKATAILENKTEEVTARLTQVCELLQNNISYYDWVGFYFKNEQKPELKLRAFAGEPTEHTIIPFGKGICGQVAVTNQNFIVPDVKGQDNYIACGINVKAEIVVPLFRNDENIGQIDIDSHSANPFSNEDEVFLEWVNARVSEIL